MLDFTDLNLADDSIDDVDILLTKYGIDDSALLNLSKKEMKLAKKTYVRQIKTEMDDETELIE